MPYKLLLADDSVTIQRVIELTFADEDVQVVAVGDGAQAIARLQSDPPDIVLADVGMPERNGYEVAAFVKEHPHLAHIPVLLLTGAFEPVDEARARSVGCDGVLVKPFEPQMVINRVKDLLAGGRSATPWSGAAEAPAHRAGPAALAPAGPAASGASLEDYFDRLDAAFASLDGGTPADGSPIDQFAATPPVASRGYEAASRTTPGTVSPLDDLAGWDPDLTGDPTRPAPSDAWRTAAEPPPLVRVALETAPPPTPPSAAPVPPTTWSPAANPSTFPAGPLPTLADAFTALLAAEQGLPFSVPARPSPVSQDTVDEIVRRVLAEMSDQVVRGTVADIAERLVREEIARIKSHA